MKYGFLLSLLLLISFSSCTDDPCDDPNNVECPTGDFDMDGIANGEDDDPEDACSPNFPSFPDLVVGTWDWGLLGQTGTCEIKADGTYEDINNELVNNGEIATREWTANVLGKLTISIQNTDGQNAGLNLQSTNSQCNRITFDGQGFGDIIWQRR